MPVLENAVLAGQLVTRKESMIPLIATDQPKSLNSSSPTISITLDGRFHAYVLKAAKEDDRTPSKWLKRFIQEQLEAFLQQ